MKFLFTKATKIYWKFYINLKRCDCISLSRYDPLFLSNIFWPFRLFEVWILGWQHHFFNGVDVQKRQSIVERFLKNTPKNLGWLSSPAGLFTDPTESNSIHSSLGLFVWLHISRESCVLIIFTFRCIAVVNIYPVAWCYFLLMTDTPKDTWPERMNMVFDIICWWASLLKSSR